ncbi:MAG: Unknown protein [uncultured Sulfurovum sp.]|uniref:Mechanosensitive ion channel n=1 Tax=uncultured Sulfurovum sp. TaxID=269237 RepID=A0A6S6TYA3_9BACT|nr:MAG: Unknown protein [uncultured Sulfurovum sp.]
MLKQITFILLTLMFFLTISFSEENNFYNLEELFKSKTMLEIEIKTKIKERSKSTSEEEKEELKEIIKELQDQFESVEHKFQKTATGIDIRVMKLNKEKTETSLSQDLQLLIEPLIKSAKGATNEMREKVKLQEELDYYKEMLPQAVSAKKNIEAILEKSTDLNLNTELKKLHKYWEQQIKLLSRNLNASLDELEMVKKNSVSFASSVKESTKNFFQERGLYLFEGLMAFIVVVVMMKLIYFVMINAFPIFTKASRSFYLRLLDLFYRLLTIIFAIVAPMTIFYIEEDWFLFSIGLLIFLGVMWTFRSLISNLWQQARLFLNIGSVREDERIYYNGLPWKVKSINIFTTIENPVSGLSLRIPIEKLVGLDSRPAHAHEPWFPCRLNDWVLLSDGYYGKAIGISLEFIEFEDAGGGEKTYLVSDFLALSPVNISTNFRVLYTLGISYQHQKESTNIVIRQLREYLLSKIEEEDYHGGLKKLIVQFSNAGDSSLDILILANFSGEMAPLYNSLRRAIARWSVDACTEYGWEIPFPQVTIHQGE